jgi:hypothetical protein
MATADLRLTVSTEVSLGDLAEQVYNTIMMDVPSSAEVDALAHFIVLLNANYSASVKHGEFVSKIWNEFHDDFVKYEIVPGLEDA